MAEIIKRIEIEKSEEIRKNEASLTASSEKQRLALKARSEREVFERTRTQKVLDESRVVEYFTEIKENLVPDGVLVNEKTGVSLKWEIDENPESFKYITAIVNPDKSSLSINGNEVCKLNMFGGISKSGKDRIEREIARAFLHPKSFVDEPPEPPYPDTGGGR